MFLAFSTYFQQLSVDLFALMFLLRFDSSAPRSVFAIKFAYANLALKTSAAKVLNSGVVIYLS